MHNYFQEIYCINIEEELGKWKQFKNEFIKNNLDWKIKRFGAIKNKVRGKGASLSHLELIKIAHTNKFEHIFIFEDDTKFIDWNLNYLEDAINHLPSDWQIFNIGYNICANENQLKYQQISKNLIKVEKGCDLRSNNAYAINNNAFEYIIREYSRFFEQWKEHKFKWHLDLWFAQNFDRYCLVPLMCVQNQGDKPQRFIDNFSVHRIMPILSQ